MLIRGHLSFAVGEHQLEFIHQPISAFGVTGLAWAPLDPIKDFGRKIAIQIKVPANPPLLITCPAQILREQTLFGEYMGLKFLLTEKDKKALQKAIDSQGYSPTEYNRKYPRIPSDETVQTFPMKAIALPFRERNRRRGETELVFGDPILMEIENLSPNGILLSTDSTHSIDLSPGDALRLILEPRGWFPHQIEMDGEICRVSDEINPDTGNLRRFCGIRFNRVTDENRQRFLDLLKDILERMKIRDSGKSSSKNKK